MIWLRLQNIKKTNYQIWNKEPNIVDIRTELCFKNKTTQRQNYSKK